MMERSAEVLVPAPAATVILLREAGERLEVLFVQRSSKLAFHGGAWVFPGGRVDPEDVREDGEEAAARRAAAREAREEAGVIVDPDALVPFAHWTTPPGPPRRFSTWFFVGAAGDGDVTVDGGEISDHAWHSPEEAIAGRAEGRIELAPPTYVSVLELLPHRRISSVLDAIRGRELPVFEPRIVPVEGGMCCLYAGDAGFDAGDATLDGARHRLLMVESDWRYERQF
jgi:8-oxo-dGTP pyrophosphatase MutT (NUDIX family)